MQMQAPGLQNPTVWWLSNHIHLRYNEPLPLFCVLKKYRLRNYWGFRNLVSLIYLIHLISFDSIWCPFLSWVSTMMHPFPGSQFFFVGRLWMSCGPCCGSCESQPSAWWLCRESSVECLGRSWDAWHCLDQPRLVATWYYMAVLHGGIVVGLGCICHQALQKKDLQDI